MSVDQAEMTAPPFRKILIANRGEIAIRIARTCRERGIATVAVYSEADRSAPHRFACDQAVEIGPAASAQSYLRVEAIIKAALACGAEAIHPGYGFLSERAALVEACEAAGITFIGPPTKAMEVMGDKVRSRRAMVEAGVPVVPGRDELKDDASVEAAAQEIGFPLMLKASAGGGGKGMRIVHEAKDLLPSFRAAAREAEASFGDGRVFCERAVMRARHVEIQVMAAADGTVFHLHERDCSVQRRHQKVIEEAPSPSPAMSPKLRAAMGAVACRAAEAVDYRGAGTVEFLFEEDKDAPDGARYYFLEMNTRLQVEHPVTEAVTGRDLVWDQIRVAAGWPIEAPDADEEPKGHAIECRIYAEDPERFLPSPGKITRLDWPTGDHLRVDSAVVEGSVVSSFYDPMIAKLTVWAPDRPSALARMRVALGGCTITGIATNLRFHQRVFAEADFCEGHFSTRYIQEHPALCEPPELDAERRAMLTAAAAAHRAAQTGGSLGGPGAIAEGDRSREPSAWQRALHPGG